MTTRAQTPSASTRLVHSSLSTGGIIYNMPLNSGERSTAGDTLVNTRSRQRHFMDQQEPREQECIPSSSGAFSPDAPPAPLPESTSGGRLDALHTEAPDALCRRLHSENKGRTTRLT